MVITLDGNRVLVDIDGSRVTTFDPAGKDVPAAASGTSSAASRALDRRLPWPADARPGT